MRKKLLSLLVLLMVAVTGAWADGIVCSASDLGKVLCTDGSIYATLSDATAASKTAAAIIAYVDETNKKGLALALTDEASEMDWATAMSASGAAAHTPVVDGQTWKLPSQEEWTLVKNANSGTSLNSAITNAGGTAIPTVHFDHETQTMTGQYWLSTQGAIDESARTWGINGYDEIAVGSQSLKTDNLLVRACLEFTIEEAAPEPQPAGYAVSLKAETADEGNWTAKAGEGDYQSLPLTGLEAGTAVSVKYSGTKKVKSVKAVKKAAAGPTYNETKSINDGPVTVAAGEHWLITGTGTQTSNTMSIGAGATVTLDGVNISSSGYCIKCAGDATIILKDGSTNTLTGTGSDYPALWAGDTGTTLTIQGSTGALTVVQIGDYCAGIGGGYSNTNNTCGNIRIEGGVITVQGGHGGAGIGTDANPATCGDIIITGGTITATGGNYAAGIGSGDSGSCGTVTITDGVTSVTATKGNNADYSIGAGFNSSCGTITIGGVVGAITESPFTYPAPAGNPAPTTASIEDYTAGTFGWNGDGSAATNLPTINTFAANGQISILSAKNTNTQFTTSAGGASATFSGTATDDSKFYAVYPYTDGLTLSGDVISGIVIPSIQWNGKWYEENNSAWDPNAPVAYATTTGSSLQFHNLCAILKIKVVGSSGYSDAGKITISADQALAGTFSLDTSTGTLTATDGSTTVYTGDDNWVYFENNYCYFAIAPGTYSNFKVRTDIWGALKEEKTKASVTFEKGKIYDLGEFSCN